MSEAIATIKYEYAAAIGLYVTKTFEDLETAALFVLSENISRNLAGISEKLQLQRRLVIKTEWEPYERKR